MISWACSERKPRWRPPPSCATPTASRSGTCDDRVSSSQRYYITDHLGGVIDVIGGAGNVIQKSSLTGRSGGRRTPPFDNRWRFAQGYFDDETGLHKLSVRHYDQQLARFTQLDPLSASYPARSR